jgi:hypothetical protein
MLDNSVYVIILHEPKGLVQVVKALVLKVCSLQGPRFNTSWMQSIPWGHTPGEKPAIYHDLFKETSEGCGARIPWD